MTTALWIVLVIFAWPTVVILALAIAFVCDTYKDIFLLHDKPKYAKQKKKLFARKNDSPIRLVK